MPLRRRKFAHVALILGWLAFWLNTAFIPCCEAFAAALGDHADDVAQSVAVQSHTQDSHATDGERTHHVPASPCDQTPNAQSATNGDYSGLPSERLGLNCDAPDMLVAASYITASQSAKLALDDFHPPPRPREVRLYLQTQRLLI